MTDYNISIGIESLFKGSGFDQAMREIKSLQKQMQAQTEFNQFKTAADNAGILIKQMDNGNLMFERMKQSANGAMKSVTISGLEAIQIIEQQSQAEVKAQNAREKALSDAASARDKMMREWRSELKELERGLARQEAAEREAANTFRRNEQAKARAVHDFTNQFSMSYLGVLFFGMQLQNTFLNLARTTVGSFMKITEGMHPAAQAANSVMATFELLKFTIGEALLSALEPFIPKILEVILAVTDWVEQNKNLVAWLIIGGIAVGGFLYWFGQLYLGFEAIGNVIRGFLLKMGIFKPVIDATGAAVITFVKGALSALLIKLAIIVAIIAVFYAAWKANFGGIQEFTKNTFGIIWEVIKSVFSNVIDIVKSVWNIVKAIFRGDGKAIIYYTIEIFSSLVKIVAKILTGLFMIIVNIGLFIYNVFKDAVIGIINIFYDFKDFGKKIMADLGIAILKALSKPFDIVINKINNVINKIAEITGLDFIKSFTIGNVDSLISDLEKYKEEVDSVNESREEMLKGLSERLSTGYFNKENYNGITEQIDKNLNGIMEGVAAYLEVELESKAAATEKATETVLAASDSVITKNYEEAESWMYKTEAMDEYVKKMRDLQTGAVTPNLNMDDYLANYNFSGM